MHPICHDLLVSCQKTLQEVIDSNAILFEPKDVGCFFHDNSFEFDIHNFGYHEGALRFWNGTPAVAPFILAAHSIGYANQITHGLVRQDNIRLLALLDKASGEHLVSPKDAQKCIGTAILQFGEEQSSVLNALKLAYIGADARNLGSRVLPHIYKDEDDIEYLIQAINQAC